MISRQESDTVPTRSLNVSKRASRVLAQDGVGHFGQA